MNDFWNFVKTRPTNGGVGYHVIKKFTLESYNYGGEGSVEDDDDEEEKRRAAYMRNIHTANETEICGSQSYKYLIRRFMSVQFNFNWFVHLNIGEIERLLI